MSDARDIGSDRDAIESTDAGVATDAEASCDLTDAIDHYQPCYGDRSHCRGLNAACIAYAPEPDHTFCAAFCSKDEECPRLSGFQAACNFAWCAVLCDDGECPDGMVCTKEVAFIDHTGQDRGVKDVCVTAPSDR